MSSPSVLDSPGDYDYFTLNGEASPGIAKRVSGGGRKIVIEDQGQILEFGKSTVVRSRNNAVITYGFKLWLPAHFAQKERWVAMFEAGCDTLNPKPYRFVDLSIPNVTKVIYEDEDPQKPAAPGGPWDWTLTLHQFLKRKKAGGPIIPGALDAQLNAQRAINEGKAAKLASLQGQVASLPPGKR